MGRVKRRPENIIKVMAREMLPIPKVNIRGCVDPLFKNLLFITSQICRSSSTAPSVTRKTTGTES